MLANILLAEDDPRLQALGRKVLERQGYQVTLASDGEEAFDLAMKTDFDVILMDLSMPKMDGYEAMKKIKEFKPNMSVVAVTAHAMKTDRERCLAQGFDEHLAKPYQVPQLMAVVASFASDWAKSMPTLQSFAFDPAASAGAFLQPAETASAPASPSPEVPSSPGTPKE